MLSSDELDKYTPWLISVAKTGSSMFPWISNPRDTDYVLYVTDNTCCKEIVELHKRKPTNECWVIDQFDDHLKKSRLYAYAYKFLEPVYGNKFPQYDIFEHSAEYKETLVNFGLNRQYAYGVKLWYHVLTGIYMLNNNSYELTEEQARNVQLCHDGEMSLELYDWIQHQLQQFASELQKESLDET